MAVPAGHFVPASPCMAVSTHAVVWLRQARTGWPDMGWFEGTFDVITQDWDMISKIRAQCATRLNELYMATAAQTHGAQSRDREVVL